MRRITLLLLVMAALSMGMAVTSYPYETESFKMQFPHAWWLDPFSSSSVCDCPGVIAGWDEEMPKLVIYGSDAAGMQEPMRDQVWDYRWDADFAGKVAAEFTSKSGVHFTGHRGQWVDHADDHTVVRLEASSGKRHVRVFIFGPAAGMQSHYAKAVDVLTTFVWLKAKRSK